MSNDEIMIKLLELENRIKNNEANIKELKLVQKQMQDLTFSVRELAIGVKNLTTNMDSIQNRVRDIELEPRELHKAVSKQIVIAFVSCVVTAIVTFLLAGGIK